MVNDARLAPYSLFPIPYSLFPIPSTLYPLFPIPYSLDNTKLDRVS